MIFLFLWMTLLWPELQPVPVSWCHVAPCWRQAANTGVCTVKAVTSSDLCGVQRRQMFVTLNTWTRISCDVITDSGGWAWCRPDQNQTRICTCCLCSLCPWRSSRTSQNLPQLSSLLVFRPPSVLFVSLLVKVGWSISRVQEVLWALSPSARFTGLHFAPAFGPAARRHRLVSCNKQTAGGPIQDVCSSTRPGSPKLTEFCLRKTERFWCSERWELLIFNKFKLLTGNSEDPDAVSSVAQLAAELILLLAHSALNSHRVESCWLANVSSS